jgi:hypothetical protein
MATGGVMLNRLFLNKNILFVFMSVVLAGLLPILPLGVYFRLVLFVLFLGVLALAWMLRSSSNYHPAQAIYCFLFILIVMLILWPRYVFFNIGSLPRVNPYTLFLFFSLLCILVFSIYSPSFLDRAKTTLKEGRTISLLLIFWIVWRIFANFFGNEPIASYIIWFRDVIYLLSFFLIGSIFFSYKNADEHFVKILLACSFLASCFGVVETLRHENYFVGFASVGDNSDAYDAIKNITTAKMRDGMYRAQSVFSNPIVFAQIVSACLPMMIYGLIAFKGKTWKIFSVLSLLVGVIAILCSGARSGLVASIIGSLLIGLFFFVRSVRSGYLSKVLSILSIPVMAMAVGISFIFVQSLLYGQSRLETNSGSVRLIMLNNAISALGDSPIFGYGDGMAPMIAGLVSTSGIMTIDSYFLSVAVDGGYLSLALFLLIVSVVIYQVFKFGVLGVHPRSFYLSALGASFISLICVFSVLSITDGFGLFWLIAAAITAEVSRIRSDNGSGGST